MQKPRRVTTHSNNQNMARFETFQNIILKSLKGSTIHSVFSQVQQIKVVVSITNRYHVFWQTPGTKLGKSICISETRNQAYYLSYNFIYDKHYQLTA